MTATLLGRRHGVTDAASAASPARRHWSGAAIGIGAWVIGVIFIVPLLYMLLTSFHARAIVNA